MMAKSYIILFYLILSYLILLQEEEMMAKSYLI